jgi:hypothetical protein
MATMTLSSGMFPAFWNMQRIFNERGESHIQWPVGRYSNVESNFSCGEICRSNESRVYFTKVVFAADRILTIVIVRILLTNELPLIRDETL